MPSLSQPIRVNRVQGSFSKKETLAEESDPQGPRCCQVISYLSASEAKCSTNMLGLFFTQRQGGGASILNASSPGKFLFPSSVFFKVYKPIKVLSSWSS